jgi:hypothetical protein
MMKRRYSPKVTKGERSTIRRKKIPKSLPGTTTSGIWHRTLRPMPSKEERYLEEMMENKKKDDELREALERGLDQFSFWGMRKPK